MLVFYLTVLKKIIHYIYNDDLTFFDSSNLEDAFDLIRALNHLELSRLRNYLIADVIANINLSNLAEILNHSLKTEDTNAIIFSCLKLANENADYFSDYQNIEKITNELAGNPEGMTMFFSVVTGANSKSGNSGLTTKNEKG